MNLFTFRTTTHPTTPAGIGRSNVMPATKRRALILISSGRQLPLAAPAEVTSISTGFFLVEMAQVLKEFENDYEFTFATPDGNAPQLDINGMALSVHAIEKTGAKTLPMRMQQRRRSFDVNSFRQRHPDLVARREQEVQLLERHIGRIPVSELLPNSEPELSEYRPELIRRLDKLPEGTFHSLPELVGRHRDPADPFTFADFDFIHASRARRPDCPTSSTWPSRKPASPSRPPPTSPPRNWPTSRPCGCSPATARRPSTGRPPSCAASSPTPAPPGAPAASN